MTSIIHWTSMWCHLWCPCLREPYHGHIEPSSSMCSPHNRIKPTIAQVDENLKSTSLPPPSKAQNVWLNLHLLHNTHHPRFSHSTTSIRKNIDYMIQTYPNRLHSSKKDSASTQTSLLHFSSADSIHEIIDCKTFQCWHGLGYINSIGNIINDDCPNTNWQMLYVGWHKWVMWVKYYHNHITLKLQ